MEGPRRLGQSRRVCWGDVGEDLVATTICDLNDGLSAESSRGRRDEGWEGAHGNHVERDFAQLGFHPDHPKLSGTALFVSQPEGRSC